eukprot:TRINITY_DN44443_c0_g1_i10.p1 TRINITY_DN44443_c0_g1~~TRINITY_DN44443_c0_g1_i10.p1  ORF type:complete len:663 (-),score=91.10 TRINITY_DN44443_c0_g1_i10:340-2328(-)
MGKQYKYIYEVNPGQVASGDQVEAGPEYSFIENKKESFVSIEHSDGISSLYELFEASVQKYSDNNCLGFREQSKEDSSHWSDYQWLTYKQVQDQVAYISSSCKTVFGLSKGSKVGIFGANSVEWMIAMQACNRMGYVCVPLYDSLGENAIEYIVDHSESQVVFVSFKKFMALVMALPLIKTKLVGIVVWGTAGETLEAEVNGIPVHSFEDFLEKGTSNIVQADPSSSADLATIMYTSGTTGDPKGVMLTHSNLLAIITASKTYSEYMNVYFGSEDVFLSYLPLAHIFDRTCEELLLYCGSQIGYWRGDIKMLVDDIGCLKPTYFAGVPRVFDRIYNGVMDKVAAGGCVKGTIFRFFYSRKLANIKRGVKADQASPLGDALAFGKIKERLGGRVRAIVSGGAPLAPHIEEFLKVCMCANSVVQGYGLTETCAASFVALPHYSMSTTVGPCTPCNTFRLEAVPEMNYSPSSDPPRGEVLIRGPNVFKGYYKMPDKTEECLSRDGWFYTGDIGELTSEGALRIIDRKKNIFKLSQGEYVAAEKLENTYKQNDLIDQIFVYGNSFESYLVAIVVPNEEKLLALTGSTDFPSACLDKDAIEKVIASLAETASKNKLKGFEKIAKLYLESDPFTPENDLLTPTFKLKRVPLQKKYQKQIDEMYAALKK